MDSQDGRDYIAPGAQEVAWHNSWGTAADYEVPASGCFSWPAGAGCEAVGE